MHTAFSQGGPRVGVVDADQNGGGGRHVEAGGANVALEEAVATARSFVDAVAWGEHLKVWELLGEEGRRTVLRVAVERGMSQALSLHLGNETATKAERDGFLTDLVNGLRADLAGTDLDALLYWSDPASAEPGRAWVVLSAPLPEILGGEVPVGTLELSSKDGVWLVERVIPRPSRPADGRSRQTGELSQ